ncbi:MAG TPA: molybdopterin-dependent oxidoreductase, partial [Candidatus Baltobacteraceae bacterium]|nr:molybdopterin-dependent oxidoreductase [Candidatus Baltobacteraceae bacterium]
LWARKLQDAIAAGGPAGIAAIGGGRLTNEEAYLLARIFRGIGVESVDHRAGRQYRATPSKAGSTYDDVVQAQTIFLLGRPPSQTAPILDLHVRKAVTKNGARLIAIGPHSAGSFVPSERYSNASEVPADAFAVERVVGIWDGVDLTFADGLYERLHGGDHTPVSIGLLIPGDQPNARGAEAMGMLPREGALDTRGIFEAARDGKIRVLSLFGVNPLLRFADGRLARAALDGSAFTVVSDLFMTETAQQADLVLPARATFEKSGHVTSLTGATTALARAQLAPLGTLSDLEMLIALAAEIGVPVPSARELETAATSYRSEIVPRELFATAPPPASGDGAAPRAALRVAFAENAFSGGCTARFDGSVDALRPRPTATLAPKTAAALGLAPGDLVDLELDGNPILRGLTVRIDDELEVGTVALIDALPEAPANVIAPSATLSLAARRPTRVGVPA